MPRLRGSPVLRWCTDATAERFRAPRAVHSRATGLSAVPRPATSRRPGSGPVPTGVGAGPPKPSRQSGPPGTAREDQGDRWHRTERRPVLPTGHRKDTRGSLMSQAQTTTATRNEVFITIVGAVLYGALPEPHRLSLVQTGQVSPAVHLDFDDDEAAQRWADWLPEEGWAHRTAHSVIRSGWRCGWYWLITSEVKA